MKKSVLTLLALSMLCSFSAQTFAETAADDADRVLALVESRIAIPNNYDAFLSDSYTDENGKEYTFSWESDEKSLEVAANENGIISSYQYTDNEISENQKPKKTAQDDLYKTACGYVRQLNPAVYGNLKITANADNEYRANESYYFDIQRYENNIPVEGNGGYIAVSADGTLKDFYLTYTTGVEFEKADKVISRSDAQKAYAEKIGFKLCYGSSYIDDKIAAFPLYTTNDNAMEYIGAASGEPIKLNDITYLHDGLAEEKNAAVPYPEARYEYTEARTNELKGMTGIISEKQAEKTVRNNKIIKVPKNYKLKNISGNKDCDNDRCFYTLLFTGARNSDFVEVMMDAKNGEIVNFSKTQNTGKSVITSEKAKTIAKNTVAYLAPKHTKDYILDYAGDNGVFSFVRKVNGIEFAANQIDIYVDMTNGNVVWYDYSYNDIKFPSLEKVISAEKISGMFFENMNFEPRYVLNCSKSGMTKYDRATLVYKFSDSDITELDAFTGKPIWDGAEENLGS